MERVAFSQSTLGLAQPSPAEPGPFIQPGGKEVSQVILPWDNSCLPQCEPGNVAYSGASELCSTGISPSDRGRDVLLCPPQKLLLPCGSHIELLCTLRIHCEENRSFHPGLQCAPNKFYFCTMNAGKYKFWKQRVFLFPGGVSIGNVSDLDSNFSKCITTRQVVF